MFLKPLGLLTDDELMQRVAGKDDDKAYGELYHRHARRLMGFFFRQMNGDEALAADLTQDAFMRVWTARDRFLGSNFRAWFMAIAYNLLKNHYRHIGYQREYELFAVQSQKEEADNTIIDDMDNEAFDQALRRELGMLTPAGRLLFSLRFEEELTVPEIAALMELPEGTVKSRLHTLTQLLKQNFGRHENIRR